MNPLRRLSAALLAALIFAPATAAVAQDPGVLPPTARYRGYTYGEWEALWWQAMFATPVDGDHPFVSGKPLEGPKGVFFLANLFADPDEPAVVEITIPAGTPLFFAIVNAECSLFESDPFHGDDEAEMRACANDHIDNTSGRYAVIDGQPVNLDNYRFESPLFTWGPLPEDNILGDPSAEGVVSPAVDAGYYLLLAPLSVGQHVIEIGGTFDEFGASFNTVYLVTVAPKGA
jgi:hypothetical protein